MKKQIKKLSLGKRTISNLSSLEMTRHIGGGHTQQAYTCVMHNSCFCSGNCTMNYDCTYMCSASCKGNTCNGKCGLPA